MTVEANPDSIEEVAVRFKDQSSVEAFEFSLSPEELDPYVDPDADEEEELSAIEDIATQVVRSEFGDDDTEPFCVVVGEVSLRGMAVAKGIVVS